MRLDVLIYSHSKGRGDYCTSRSHVRCFMIIQRGLLRKSLPTDITIKWFFPSMCSTMSKECTTLGKRFRTQIARERAETGVDSLVHGEVVRILEEFPTQLTPVKTLVCSAVGVA